MASEIADRRYGQMVEVDMDFDEAVEQTTAALKAEGFGVLTTIEVDRVLDEKIGAKIERYTILGACNPELAKQGLEADIDLGLLLPCNVVVREDGGQRIVTFVDPKAMLAAAGDSPALAMLAEDAGKRLDTVADSLASR
jgi:uncharacterized protein (DUF302 family)